MSELDFSKNCHVFFCYYIFVRDMRKRIKRNHPRTNNVRGWFYDLKKYKLLAVVFVHDLDEVNNLVAVTDLVVIP